MTDWARNHVHIATIQNAVKETGDCYEVADLVCFDREGEHLEMDLPTTVDLLLGQCITRLTTVG